jgi:hypothetical protein
MTLNKRFDYLMGVDVLIKNIMVVCFAMISVMKAKVVESDVQFAKTDITINIQVRQNFEVKLIFYFISCVF